MNEYMQRFRVGVLASAVIFSSYSSASTQDASRQVRELNDVKAILDQLVKTNPDFIPCTRIESGVSNLSDYLEVLVNRDMPNSMISLGKGSSREAVDGSLAKSYEKLDEVYATMKFNIKSCSDVLLNFVGDQKPKNGF